MEKELLDSIENKKKYLKRRSNTELLTLFWQVGNDLNIHLQKPISKKYKNNFIKEISYILEEKYGVFFSKVNICKMMQFAELFPVIENIQALFCFLTWEHIKVIAKLKDQNTALFYISKKITEALSVIVLKKSIVQNDYNSMERIIDINNKNYKKLYAYILANLTTEVVDKNEAINQSVFSKATLPATQKLLTARSYFYEDNNAKTVVVKPIALKIDAYIKQQNYWLNAHHNLLSWKIGNTLFNALKEIKTEKEKSLQIASFCALLQQYNLKYTKADITDMLLFAKHIRTEKMALAIAYNATWPTIKLLNTLQYSNYWLAYIAHKNASTISDGAWYRLFKQNRKLIDISSFIKNTTPSTFIKKIPTYTIHEKRKNNFTSITFADYMLVNNPRFNPTVFKQRLFVKMLGMLTI